MDKSDGGKGKKSDVSDGVDKVHKNIAKTCLSQDTCKVLLKLRLKIVKAIKIIFKKFLNFC